LFSPDLVFGFAAFGLTATDRHRKRAPSATFRAD